MQIKRLVIENFKSIERIELIEPNPFTVFVGPNGSGKSNIFEALEFVNLAYKTTDLVESLFGGQEDFLNRRSITDTAAVGIDFGGATLRFSYSVEAEELKWGIYANSNSEGVPKHIAKTVDNFTSGFSRLFVKNLPLQKLPLNDNKRLSLSASNLERVLRRVLADETLKAEVFEWLGLFVPSFKAVEVDDRDELNWFEKAHARHFTKELISDGTYNILAMLTAVYQSDDKPQFLCIEEPENGLHPQVARELVDFFRTMCEERGHYIWLNTHSPYMVSRVRPEELVVVDKVNGATQVKQFKGQEFNGMRMDEAWLTNVLNGGKAW